MKRIIWLMLCMMIFMTGCSNANELTISSNELENQAILLGQNPNNHNLYLISTDIQMSEDEFSQLLSKPTDHIIKEYENLYWLDVSNVTQQVKDNLKAGVLITYTLQSNIQKDTRPPTLTATAIRISGN